MKKIILLAFVMFFAFGTTSIMANDAETKANTEDVVATKDAEKKLSDEEIKRLVERVEEIRALDKSEMTKEEKKELRKEVKEMKEKVRQQDATIYIGGSTLLIILLLIIIL